MRWFCLLLLGVCACRVAAAQHLTVAELRALVNGPGSLNLDQGDSSFHLSATFDALDYKGKPQGTGTIEVYRDASGRGRVDTTFNGQLRSVFYGKGTPLVAGAPAPVSRSAQFVTDAIFPYIPKSDVEHDKLSVMSTTLGKVQLDCLLLQPDAGKGDEFKPRPISACYSPTTRILRALQRQDITFLFDDLSVFAGHPYARTTYLRVGSTLRATVHVLNVEPWKLDAALLDPPFDAKPAPPQVVGVRLDKLILPQPILHAEPEYPRLMREQHETGDVVLNVIITPEGNVEDARVVSTPSIEFNQAALETVSHWTFTPALYQGEPITVQTDLRVSFRLPPPSR